MTGKVLVVAVVLGLAGAGSAVAQQPDGAALYARTCASCHGAQGTPTPAMAKAMTGIPDFAARTTSAVPDSVLREAIVNGKGRMMASYKTRLTPDQVTALITYIRTLAKH